MSNNIRTISQLDDLNNGSPTFDDLSSANLFIEVSKNKNSNVQTYKLSMATFLNLLIRQIHIDGNEWWVTLSGEDQTISTKKTFNGGVNFGNGTTNISNNGTISSDAIIEGIARKAYWA